MIELIPQLFSFSSLTVIGSQLIFALLLDRILGEPARFHPLIGFGNLANRIEAKFNPQQNVPEDDLPHVAKARFKGMIGWLILVVPLPIALWGLNYCAVNFAAANDSSLVYWLIGILNSFVLYLAIGLQSLTQHAMQIYHPLKHGDMDQARHFTGYMVSRDTQSLTPKDMRRAAVESVLENGHDGVIASLFYFVIGGAPLVVLHRLINTLDAMWGYKTPRFLYFGWWAARADDHLGWASTYCTSLLYVLAAPKTHQSKHLAFEHISRAWRQAKDYKSKNGGRCMAIGASALGFTLGGTAHYQGNTIRSPLLGNGNVVALGDIPRSVALVKRSAWLFAFAVLSIGLTANAIF